MILIENFPEVMAQLEKERGIDKKTLIEALSMAMIAATKKKFGNVDNLEVSINTESGETRIFANRTVSAEVTDPFLQISLAEAKKINDMLEIDDVIAVEVTPKQEDLGRLAAQTAKQVISQKIREAEKDLIQKEFSGKMGSIVSGTVQRIEGRNILVNLGRVEALLYPREQIHREHFDPKDPIKVFVVGVEKTHRGPQVVISRSHAGLVKKLFELEVPEIRDGVIEVKGISREAGYRTKIAVHSNNPDVGAVGTCVGHMGQRIQAILKELGQERVDIIEWSDDIKKYISNSLKPAKVDGIKIDEKTKKAVVEVAPDQLSLAIGRSGQNVRLASKLTGWDIEIPEPEKPAVVEEAPVVSAESATQPATLVAGTEPTKETAQ
jgi:N utilization substance protein A